MINNPVITARTELRRAVNIDLVQHFFVRESENFFVKSSDSKYISTQRIGALTATVMQKKL